MSSSVLLTGGTVVDPESGSMSVQDVLVRDGVVAELGDVTAPEGADVLDVSGLVVGPGFVDLHSHVHSVAGQRLQAYDGVTTALDLEAGLIPVERGYAEAAAAGRPLHYGFSASWGGARAKVLLGVEPDATMATGLSVLGNPGWQRSSTPRELADSLALMERELGAGALGIGILLGYAPRLDPAEYLAVARLAAAAGRPTYTHVRELVEADPSTPIDGSEEVVRAAAETGAAMHHCHVNSTSRRHVDRVLGMLDKSRAEGSRVTVEAYPYGAGSTAIGAAFLEPSLLGRWDIGPSSLVMVGTGERIRDERRLRELRADSPGETCIIEFLDETDPADAALLRRSLEHPDAMVASDAMPVTWDDGSYDTRDWPLPPGGTTHPRTAGTFLRAIRMMVREEGAWTWPEAFRRCSYLPAQVLAETTDAMHGKGRLAVGSDADLVVLDPDAVTDRATYTDPTRPSVGVRHLLVAGRLLIRDGALDTQAYPGRPIRA
ncbi:amidohydrolase family protein [Nocardioides sp. cx-173]|uniref:amidohydrolase family protein n=1 Tax=Nocardioides sp. cx-173 TaxID=2898796 RepID=UPI001E409195|nr:amidohydrolase family protein [Nocardioides sp. cx-173]MCD4524841.1 amidohydrolase family protein [Nocardioides sp. cx-173]UGB43346.1 amidohydrolase family protein [Nocardioides sp. cx-173]